MEPAGSPAMAVTVQLQQSRGGNAGLIVLILLALALAVFAFSGALTSVVAALERWLRGTAPTTGAAAGKAAAQQAKRPPSSGSRPKGTPAPAPASNWFGISQQQLQALRQALNRDFGVGGGADIPLPEEGIAIP
jgi:hypothetical protein